MNDTAGDALELVDGQRDAPAVAEALADRYEAEPSELLGDVRTLLDDLTERGFLLS